MNRFGRNLLLACFAAATTFLHAEETAPLSVENFLAEPIALTDAKISETTWELDGVFRASFPKGGQVEKTIDSINPNGLQVLAWKIEPSEGNGAAHLSVMGFNCRKIPPFARSETIRSLLKSFRSVGNISITKTGFALNDFHIREVQSDWERAFRAESTFSKSDQIKVNITYAFAGERLYMVAYDGPEGEPRWFVELRRSLMEIGEERVE